MTHYLFDTNIISELGRPNPQKSVVDFVAITPVAWLSTITLHELKYGIALIPEGTRKSAIQQVVSRLTSTYNDYIIPIGQQEVQEAAILRAMMKEQGRILHLADSLIAGTAKVHNLTVATRNIKDFDGLDITLKNPFDG
ncbi:MAG: PIN domain-containing protein [uncultured Thiotrichaceae bacterium]|uniref:PIN domain-containing protein n=1 Tax=uncultured Thiotrichaceae bacterium TaxID=298394 RepID=A0A6S6UCE3_9GAMM|nr:MAG: PIN domain-containing protein [uncultured Thiotrichaceae bacterium]